MPPEAMEDANGDGDDENANEDDVIQPVKVSTGLHDAPPTDSLILMGQSICKCKLRVELQLSLYVLSTDYGNFPLPTGSKIGALKSLLLYDAHILKYADQLE